MDINPEYKRLDDKWGNDIQSLFELGFKKENRIFRDKINQILMEEIPDNRGLRNIALAVINQYGDDTDDIIGCLISIKDNDTSYFDW